MQGCPHPSHPPKISGNSSPGLSTRPPSCWQWATLSALREKPNYCWEWRASFTTGRARILPFLLMKHSVPWLCETNFFIICHRQGRNTFFVEAVQKMGKLLKRTEEWRWKPGKFLKKIWKSAHIMISLIFEDVPFLWVELFWWFWTMIGSAHHCVVFLLMKLFSWMLCKI